MATSVESPPLSQFKCFSCDTIPSDEHVIKCRIGHTICLKSKCTSNGLCKCKALLNLSLKLPNPLVQVLQTTKRECKYKMEGCTWMASDADGMDDHIKECKFRPYPCVGAEWGFWKCSWSGAQQDLATHMEHSHSVNGVFFPHWYSGSVDFIPDRVCKKINLIDAFNKKFVFLYNCHPKSSNVVFIIYLLGQKSQADKFMIDFELKDDLRKVKFIEKCYSDCLDIKSIITDHRCFVLPKKLVETYANDQKLAFRFVVKKTDSIEIENSEKQMHLLDHLADGNRTKQKVITKPQMKAYQSESHLNLNAHRSNGNINNQNGYANRKPVYKRTPKT